MAERKPTTTNATAGAPDTAPAAPAAPPGAPAPSRAPAKAPTGAAAAIAAVREAAYPVTVTKADLDAALADETLTDDERGELRNMVAQNDVVVSDR